MDLGLTDRVFLVTTGSTGLGSATAQFLVEAGARVVFSCQDTEQLIPAVDQLGGRENAVGLTADLRDPATPERLTAAAVARFGHLDGCLIGTEAISSGPVTDAGQDHWRDSFEAAVLGPIRVAKAAATTMASLPGPVPSDNGSIVFELSPSARSVVAGEAVANTLYRGLTSAVIDLADSLGSSGIRVNGLRPGRMAVAHDGSDSKRSASAERVRIRNEAEIPLGRYGEPEEFGAVAAFLLSPLSSYVTGSLITVDGGSGRWN